MDAVQCSKRLTMTCAKGRDRSGDDCESARERKERIIGYAAAVCRKHSPRAGNNRVWRCVENRTSRRSPSERKRAGKKRENNIRPIVVHGSRSFVCFSRSSSNRYQSRCGSCNSPFRRNARESLRYIRESRSPRNVRKRPGVPADEYRPSSSREGYVQRSPVRVESSSSSSLRPRSRAHLIRRLNRSRIPYSLLSCFRARERTHTRSRAHVRVVRGE